MPISLKKKEIEKENQKKIKYEKLLDKNNFDVITKDLDENVNFLISSLFINCLGVFKI